MDFTEANAASKRALEQSQEPDGQFRKMIDSIPTLAWCNSPDGSNEFVNQRWRAFTGLSAEDARGWGWKIAIHPDDLPQVLDKWMALLASGESGEIEARLRRHDGAYRWFLFRAEVLRDEQGRVLRWYGTNTDIEELKRAQSLLSTEKGTLEMVACGANLTDVLEHLCDTIDAQTPNNISTVLLMDADGTRLWPVAGRRVIHERLQPELANESMFGWSRELRQEAENFGFEIFDTTNLSVVESARYVLSILGVDCCLALTNGRIIAKSLIDTDHFRGVG